MTPRTLILLSLLVPLTTGCDARRGGGGGSGEPGDVGLAGLDDDGDGVLTDDDLASGEAAVLSRMVSGDDETESGVRDRDSRILMGDGRWFLVLGLTGTYPLDLEIGFDDENFDLVLDTGPADHRGTRATLDGYLAMGSSPEGTIEVTEGGEVTGSGWFDGTIRLEIWTEFEEPTGDEIIIDGFAFKDVAISSAWD